MMIDFMFRWPARLTLLASLAAGSVALAASPAESSKERAKALTDPKGMTMYVFDKDNDGVSNCYGPCAQAWPPVLATSAALHKPFSTVQRRDGSSQLAYKGRPLYTYIKDEKPGDEVGEGVEGVWHVARP